MIDERLQNDHWVLLYLASTSVVYVTVYLIPASGPWISLSPDSRQTPSSYVLPVERLLVKGSVPAKLLDAMVK
jgi:hypothetical protein